MNGKVKTPILYHVLDADQLDLLRPYVVIETTTYKKHRVGEIVQKIPNGNIVGVFSSQTLCNENGVTSKFRHLLPADTIILSHNGEI